MLASPLPLCSKRMDGALVTLVLVVTSRVRLGAAVFIPTRLLAVSMSKTVALEALLIWKPDVVLDAVVKVVWPVLLTLNNVA